MKQLRSFLTAILIATAAVHVGTVVVGADLTGEKDDPRIRLQLTLG